MKKILLSIPLFILFTVFIAGCDKDPLDEETVAAAENGTLDLGTGSCPVGVWYSPACGNPKGVIWTFASNKKGSFSNKDCNGICTPMVFKFTYSMSGNTCSLTYDAVQDFVYCDGYPATRPPTPKNASITLECVSGGLKVTSGNGTIVFTK